jgi:glycosyltransferase involved in cell wall biosynthesis
VSTDLSLVKSIARSRKRPVLSVLIPYYHDDPSALLHALLAQSHTRKDIEILLYDDGSNDGDLNSKVCAIVKAAETPVQLIIAEKNRGRSAARNKLQETARGDWVLFLDADMRPQNAHFISDYMQLIEGDAADVIFGGFTVPKTSDDPDTELHRALSEISDCLSLEARQARGPQYVASSNLCARKQVLEAEPFDPDFVGWGWEDSEWAARVSEAFSLRHADIPALHLGLESTETLLNRFRDSGQNYVRFTQKHPELAQTLTLFKLSKKLRRIPGQSLMRPVLKLIVKFQNGPMRLRLFALKMWRASWYAEASQCE